MARDQLDCADGAGFRRRLRSIADRLIDGNRVRADVGPGERERLARAVGRHSSSVSRNTRPRAARRPVRSFVSRRCMRSRIRSTTTGGNGCGCRWRVVGGLRIRQSGLVVIFFQSTAAVRTALITTSTLRWAALPIPRSRMSASSSSKSWGSVDKLVETVVVEAIADVGVPYGAIRACVVEARVEPRNRNHSSYAAASGSLPGRGSASPLCLRALTSASKASASRLLVSDRVRTPPLASRQRTCQRVPSPVVYGWTLMNGSRSTLCSRWNIHGTL